MDPPWLERQFDVAQTDQAYAADVTYILAQEGWLYIGRSDRPMFEESGGLEYEFTYEGAIGM